jgi:AhpD family alkylhydroperoxidase
MRIEPAPVDQSMPVFDNARERFGWLPNTVRVMARGTNAAQQYLDSGARNAEGSVPPLARELIAVMVAEVNGCDYCRTAHLLAARALGTHRNDPFIDAVVDVARCIHDTCDALIDAEVERAHAVGIEDLMLIDIAAVIAENPLGNLINNLARTEIDPVLVRALDKAVAR